MAANTLLSRDEWRRRVLDRDHLRCVVCAAPATEVHHILERRLFTDGGYYLDNGASVCNEGSNGCHLRCELGELTPQQVRTLSVITTEVVPPGLVLGPEYDKWGNVYDNGVWYPGPLFADDGVQKVLRRTRRLYLFHHTPYAPGP
jgi:hypothetical protein